jgi:hypothetical protein
MRSALSGTLGSIERSEQSATFTRLARYRLPGWRVSRKRFHKRFLSAKGSSVDSGAGDGDGRAIRNPLARSSICAACGRLEFHFQRPHHVQELKNAHIASRVALCCQLLSQREYLSVVHFSDGSRFIRGDDKRWIWYRRGEQNDRPTGRIIKFPLSLMIFAVKGIGYKCHLPFVHRTVDAEQYLRNPEALGFIVTMAFLVGSFSKMAHPPTPLR